jgi:hypothetical protein
VAAGRWRARQSMAKNLRGECWAASGGQRPGGRRGANLGGVELRPGGVAMCEGWAVKGYEERAGARGERFCGERGARGERF